MGLFSKLFSNPAPTVKLVTRLGELEFFNDGIDSYWKIERPVLNLPPEFDFGAIAGSAHSVDADALKCFQDIALQPDQLFSLLTESFFSKAGVHFSHLSAKNVKHEFYVKSITTSSNLNYEFGLHSRSKDIFVELFVRSGKVAELYLDEGFCDV